MNCLTRTLIGTAFGAPFVASCQGAGNQVSEAQRVAISTEVEQTLRDAYDLSKPNVLDRMLSLYGKSGRIVSASGGSGLQCAL